MRLPLPAPHDKTTAYADPPRAHHTGPKRKPQTERADAALVAVLAAKTREDQTYWCLPERDRRDLVHALFQYPAMMVPEVQRRLVSAILEVKPDVRSVYDPFVGAGTSLVASMRLGLDCYGQDINPLAVLLSKVKTGPFHCDRLDEYADEVVRRAKADASSAIEANFAGIDKWFRPGAQGELSKLRRAIRACPRWARRFLWVVLAETVRLTSNDRTSTYKLHARPDEEIEEREVSPLRTFEGLVEKACEDVRAHREELDREGFLRRGHYGRGNRIALGNTSAQARRLAGRRVGYDLLVTSPPYGDNHTTVTYGQHAYLPLQWIDLGDIDRRIDEEVLRTTQEIDRRSLGGRQDRATTKEVVEVLGAKSIALSDTFERLEDKPHDRTARVAFFYRDLDACLENIMAVMNDDAYMCWTVANRRVGGEEIPTHQVLRDLLERRGAVYVTEVERRIYHKRMPTRNGTSQTMRNERILVFRKQGSLA